MESIKKLLRIKQALLQWGTPKEVFDIMIEEVKEEEGIATQDLNFLLSGDMHD